MVDRKILSDNYTAFVGADNYKIGSDVGHYIVSRLNGKGNIFEVTGLQGSTPAMERHRGLMDALAGIPNIKRVGSVDGGWLQSQAGEKVDSVLRVHKDIDLLFAQNDRMAIWLPDSREEKKKCFLWEWMHCPEKIMDWSR